MLQTYKRVYQLILLILCTQKSQMITHLALIAPLKSSLP